MASEEQMKRAADELRLLRLLRDHPGYTQVLLPALERRYVASNIKALDVKTSDTETHDEKIRGQTIKDCMEILDDLERSCISVISSGEKDQTLSPVSSS